MLKFKNAKLNVIIEEIERQVKISKATASYLSNDGKLDLQNQLWMNTMFAREIAFKDVLISHEDYKKIDTFLRDSLREVSKSMNA